MLYQRESINMISEKLMCVFFLGDGGGGLLCMYPARQATPVLDQHLKLACSHGSAHLGSDVSSVDRECEQSVAMVLKCHSGDGVAGIPLPQQQGGQVLPLIQFAFPVKGDRRSQHRGYSQSALSCSSIPAVHTAQPCHSTSPLGSASQPAALAQWVGEAQGAW